MNKIENSLRASKWNKEHPERRKIILDKYYKKKKPRNKELNKNTQLKRRYGITSEEKNQMLIQQNNKCAICNSDQSLFKKELEVDHSHETGKVRGLLCHACNKALGLFKDNHEIVFKAANYLSRT